MPPIRALRTVHQRRLPYLAHTWLSIWQGNRSSRPIVPAALEGLVDPGGVIAPSYPDGKCPAGGSGQVPGGLGDLGDDDVGDPVGFLLTGVVVPAQLDAHVAGHDA